ncbi:MAG: hypothetical protein RR928_16355, partial [Comamonas sp.]|uniref:hypothetical protein n=1 Tax=Comamonas sp. TaxID=34028 RepID=UPI002FC81F04
CKALRKKAACRYDIAALKLVPSAGIEKCLESRMEYRFHASFFEKYQQKYQQFSKCPEAVAWKPLVQPVESACFLSIRQAGQSALSPLNVRPQI